MRTGTVPRSVRIARVSDGELHPFPIELPGDDRNGRPRWMPDGKSLAIAGSDASGNNGIMIQVFSPGRDTSATRHPLIDFDANLLIESYGISPDGTSVIYSVEEEINSLMLAEGLPGVEPPRRE
jgi:hypothetical protein